MLLIPLLRGLRQEDLKFKASLGYIVTVCFKKQTKGWRSRSSGRVPASQALSSNPRTAKKNSLWNRLLEGDGKSQTGLQPCRGGIRFAIRKFTVTTRVGSLLRG
jgi:hypothetical protein